MTSTARQNISEFCQLAIALLHTTDDWDDATHELLEGLGGEIEGLHSALADLEDAINNP